MPLVLLVYWSCCDLAAARLDGRTEGGMKMSDSLHDVFMLLVSGGGPFTKCSTAALQI